MIKIKQVVISGFGRWSQQQFDFVDEFQVIVGHNESGKSTLRAFIAGMLFGFPTKKGHTNVYDPKDGSHYGGSLVVDFDDTIVRITRLGRTKSELSITYLSNQLSVVDPENWLAEHLAPLTRDMFDHIFNFSQQDLAKVTQLKPIDLQKMLLNIGAVGSEDWLEVKNDIEKHSEKQFAQRATGKRPLNLASKQYQAHADRLIVKGNEVNEYVATEKEISEYADNLVQTQETVKQLTHKIQDLHLLAQQYQLYQHALQLKAQLDVPRVTVSDADIATLQRVTVISDMHQEKISQLDETIQKSTMTNKHENIDWSSELSVLQDKARDLKEMVSERQILLTKLQHLQNKFVQKKVPDPLTANEQKILNNRDMTLPFAVMTMIMGVMAFMIVKPLVIIAIIMGIYVYYLYQSRQKQMHHIQSRYGQMSLVEIQSIQSAIKEAPTQQQQVTTLETAIFENKQQLILQLESIAEQLQVPMQTDDFEALIVQLNRRNDQEQLHRYNTTLLLAQENQQKLTDIKQHQVKLAQQLAIRQKILQKYHVTSEADVQRLKVENTDYSRTYQRYNDLMNQIDESNLVALRQINNDDDLLHQTLLTQQTLEKEQQSMLTLQTQLANLKAQQKQRTSDDDFLKEQQDLADEKTVLIDQFGDYLAEKMVVKWIDQALQLASQNRFPKMSKKAISYFKKLTGEQYVAINFVKEEVVVVNQAGQTFNVIELSTGTQEQLYTALRLALSDVISDIISLPLLIDDGFVHFDVSRRQTMLTILQEKAKRQQIVYFTTSNLHVEHMNIIRL